jgi:predicted DNA-binding transcriptional regulator YafY
MGLHCHLVSVKSSRLLSIVLLLQTRGRLTAAQLAAELEVSVRTIYRDIEALQLAGIPLYGGAGHDGGYRLLAGYRTRLTGMNAREAEALFFAGIPGPAAELGLGSALAAAQLKLLAALPPEQRAQADRMRARFLLDAPGWYAQDDDVRFLPEVADAVWHSRALDVCYRRWKEPSDVGRRLEPYGLVLKAGRWYVVAGPGPRTFRVDQILELTVRDDRFQPPAHFDLAEYWRRYQAEFLAHLFQGQAVVRMAPDAATCFSGVVGQALAATAVVEPDGWIRAVLPIESLDHAHRTFLGLGADIEVLGPPDLRTRLAETSRVLAARYGSAYVS